MTVGCPIKYFISPLRFILVVRNSIVLLASSEHPEANAHCATQETEKARSYIERLNSARSGDRWHEVPALVRKIEKHAPHRSCLIVTAKSEERIISQLGSKPIRPNVGARELQLLQELSTLLIATKDEQTHVFDAFEATVCLSWVHWMLGQASSAVERLKGIVEVSVARGGIVPVSEWEKVVFVKGAYIKGISQEELSDPAGAEHTYRPLLAFIKENLRLAASSPQFRKWAYALLSRYCILTGAEAHYDNPKRRHDALRAFHAWTEFHDTSKGLLNSHDVRGDRKVWRSYYTILSNILQNASFSSLSSDELVYLDRHSTEKQTLSPKNQFRAKLQQVESAYEALMLTETRFPKAREKNSEAEWWVDMAMANWRILYLYDMQAGSTDTSRTVYECQRILEILFRAASKTFHSTRMLRHMFTVYVALSDFEMAFKAFDVYVELSVAGRSRNRRSDESETIEVDDDELYIRTLVDAIGVLCRFGGRKDAEKAREVEKLVDDWLSIHAHPFEETAYGPLSEPLPDSQERGNTAVNVSIAYRSLGISRAHWARLMYEGDKRSMLQAEALAFFKKALDSKLGGSLDIDTLYAMGLLSADMRNIPEAIKALKIALASPTELLASSSSSGLGLKTDAFGEPLHDGALFGRERKLVPLWHLLALLLTARADFSNAAKSCEAVFEQFGDQSNLLGDEGSFDSRQRTRQQSSITSDEKERRLPIISVTNIMNGFEKETLLQVKLTQLALVETVEGPTVAVDGADELFALYARLFGEPKIEGVRKLPQKAPNLRPGTATSAMRSIAGSILGKSRLSHRGRDRPQSLPAQASRPNTARTARQSHMPATQPTPSIHVTNEDGAAEKEENGVLHRRSQNTSTRQKHESILKRKSGGSLRKRRGSAPGSRPDESVPRKSVGSSEGDTSQVEDTVPPLPETGRHRNESLARAESVESSVRPVTSQSIRSEAATISQHRYPDPMLQHRDSHLAGSSPYAINLLHSPLFSILQDSRQKISLLIRLWLYVSGLYTRAGMLDDAKAALDEALKLVETFELEVAQERSSSKAFAERGWGAGASVNELWADVCTQRGILAQEEHAPHQALECFERALSYFPDHPQATVSVSDLLMDIYARKIPLEPGMDSDSKPPSPPRSTSPEGSTNAEGINGATGHANPNNTNTTTPLREPTTLSPTAPNPATTTPPTTLPSSTRSRANNPEYLSRLAARDRAYGLLSSLTKLGVGWDHSEAWLTLARVYEESGQVEKAKEALWWCVDLEDTRPVRHWTCLGPGGFVL